MPVGSKKYSTTHNGSEWKGLPSAFKGNPTGVLFETYDPNSLMGRRNLLLQSEDFDAVVSGSTTFNTVITPGATLAPDGVSLADKVACSTAASTQHWINRGNLNPRSGVTYTYSVYAKPAEYSKFSTFASGGFTGAGAATFDLTAINSPPNNGTITSVGNGWYRCTYTFTSATDSAGQAWYLFQLIHPTLGATFTGDGVSGMYFWGAQIEVGTVASTYQKITDWNTEYVAMAGLQTSLWQENVASTPVVSVGQPGGAWLDKKFSLSLGPELISNQTFTDATGWTLGTGWTISGGTLNFSNSVGTTAFISMNSTAGKTYHIEFDVSGTTVNGSVAINNPGTDTSAFTTIGHKSTVITPVANRVQFSFNGVGGSSFSIDNVTVKELPGIHVYQATTANRPIISSRSNLVVGSESLNNSAWRKDNVTITTKADGIGDKIVESVAAGATVAHDVYQAASVIGSGHYAVVRAKAGERSWMAIQNGAVAAYYNLATGTLGGIALNCSASMTPVPGLTGYYDCVFDSRNVNSTSQNNFIFIAQDNGVVNYVGDGVSGIYVARMDTRSTGDVVPTIPSYQRVNTTTDYDTAGFPFRLVFNGTNSSLQTSSFTAGTIPDNMDVFVLIKRTGTGKALVLSQNTGVSPYLGCYDSTDSLNPTTNAVITSGPFVNGTLVTDNRAALSTALPVGTWGILEYQGVNFSGFTALGISNYGTGFFVTGEIAAVIICPAQTDRRRARIRKYLAGKVGLSL